MGSLDQEHSSHGRWLEDAECMLNNATTADKAGEGNQVAKSRKGLCFVCLDRGKTRLARRTVIGKKESIWEEQEEGLKSRKGLFFVCLPAWSRGALMEGTGD